jgi:hypothetical protein
MPRIDAPQPVTDPNPISSAGTSSTAESVALSATETARLTELEAVVRRGLSTFIEVGTALMEIRDGRLYRASHDTFDHYCRDRWSMSGRRANQLALAADIAREIGQTRCEDGQDLRTIVLKPDNEGQARELAKVPPDDRAATWKEAVETAPNGKVTAGHVKKTVDRRSGKASEPEAPKPKGQSRVNGVVQDDPPEVAEMRAAGKIPPGLIPDVKTVDNPTTLESIREEHAALRAAQDSLSDEDWLKTLTLHGILEGESLKTFCRDAVAWRRTREAREQYQAAVADVLGRHRPGPWLYDQRRSLSREDPSRWQKCKPLTDGGCGGTGRFKFVDRDRPCGECHGSGYTLA